ncbi:MAG: hypothetical protein GWN58_51805 [Anaerolineae bacterium]|nr:hypothetical protein [Anaerolineae bacterium]
MSYDVTLHRRLAQLEKQEAVAAAHEPPSIWYEFLPAPSCPPDKRIHIRGGVTSLSGRWGAITQDDFIPDTVCDFENETETQLQLIFSNANWFLPLLLCFYGDWVAYRSISGYEEPVFDCVTGIEVETAAEAEAQIDTFLNGYTQWYYYRLPIWGVVLRNDGYTDVPFAIQPIDKVNRGRSYLYRDARSQGGIFP